MQFPAKEGRTETHNVRADLVDAFADVGNAEAVTKKIPDEKGMEIRVIFMFAVALVRRVLATVYTALIIAIATGYTLGFNVGYSHHLLESLSTGSGRWAYPALLSALLLMEAPPALLSSPASLVGIVDALAIAALGVIAFSPGLDFGYCHSLDRYLVMSVTTYFVPLMVVSALTVELLTAIPAVAISILAATRAVYQRIIGVTQQPAPQLPAESSETSEARIAREVLQLSAERLSRSARRQETARRQTERTESDLVVRFTGYSQAGTPTRHPLSSPASGAKRTSEKLSPSPTTTQAVTPLPQDKSRVTFAGTESAATIVAAWDGDVDIAFKATTQWQVASPSTSPGKPTRSSPTGSLPACIAGDGDSSGEESDTSGNQGLDTTPRIVDDSGLASPLWRATASEGTNDAGLRTPSASPVKALGTQDAASSSPRPVLSPGASPHSAGGDVMVEVFVAETSTNLKSTKMPGTPTPPPVDTSAVTGLTTPSAYPGDTSTICLYSARPAALSAPCTPQQASTPPGASSSGAPGDHLFESPEDEFKLHSNIKLKPLGTFSSGYGRRSVKICEAPDANAATPVEGYTNAYLMGSSMCDAPLSPPHNGKRKEEKPPAQQQPTQQPVSKAALKKGKGVGSGTGGTGKEGTRKPSFKSVFLGTGKSDIIR
jgi:hypothetical protein